MFLKKRFHVYVTLRSGAELYLGTATDISYKYDANSILSINLDNIKKPDNKKVTMLKSLALNEVVAISTTSFYSLF